MNVLLTPGLPEAFSQTLRFPRRLPLLRSMPVSAGVETRTEPTYDWNGLAGPPDHDPSVFKSEAGATLLMASVMRAMLVGLRRR